jgi:hypothetical protein
MPVLLEVVLDQTYAGQQIINRWTYMGTGTPSGVSMSYALTHALGAIWDTEVEPDAYPVGGLMWKLALIQSTSVVFNSITIKDVYSAVDFYSTLFVNALTGQATGQGMSPIVAYGFFTNRVRADIRRATKRFTGVSESDVDGLGIIAAGRAAGLTSLAGEMTQVQDYLLGGNALSFAPCVVSKERYNPDTGLADPAGRAYRYYETFAEQDDHIAEGIFWDWYPEVRSQTSRQYGKGR